MIQYVVEAFPSSVKKIIITSLSLLNEKEIQYLKRGLRCEIIDIPEHEEGPAFSIYQARHKLPLEESFFISYCDIYWTWDFSSIEKNLDADGVIYTHSGFHPHLIKNNFSAFCLPTKGDPFRLQKIQEKGSFTEDWMKEPLSVGVFYVKRGEEMMAAIGDLIEKNVRVAGEYFPSLLFNPLVAKNRNVRLQPLNFYIHWGVPEQLLDFEQWHAVIAYDRQLKTLTGSHYPDNVVVMAGLGHRMKTISEHPKALIPIDQRPMFQFVIDHFPSRSSTIITTKEMGEDLKAVGIGSELFLLDRPTRSQLDTIRLSLHLLKSRRNFFLTSCDAYGLFDIEKFCAFTKARKPDAVIFTFKPSLSHQKMGTHHSHVSVSGDRVTAVHIKSKLKPDDAGFAGFFWVNDGTIFSCMEEMPLSLQSDMYVDHVFKYFVDTGLDIARFDIPHYVHLGTPDELLEYRYWRDHEFLFSH